MCFSCPFFFVYNGTGYTQNKLDSRPLDSSIDPDIDMFMNSWQNSIPFNTHGSITERAVLNSNESEDPLKPKRKGGVLHFVRRFSFAILDGKASTTPTTLKGEQEIFYITSGKGTIRTGHKKSVLRDGIFVLVPEGLEFTIENTGDDPLKMYIICESVPHGFTPNEDLLIKDEKSIPFREKGYLTTHWSHNGKNIFSNEDRLGTLRSVNLITADPMTISQPHSHGEGIEEVWTVIEGKNMAFLGKEIRWQYPGTAYKVPPTGFTPHCNINSTSEPIKFLYFSRFGD